MLACPVYGRSVGAQAEARRPIFHPVTLSGFYPLERIPMPSPNVPILNICQKVFLLTWESNVLGGKQGDTQTLATDLQTQLNTFLGLQDVQTAMEGKWSVVWGPAVFEAQESSTKWCRPGLDDRRQPSRSLHATPQCHGDGHLPRTQA